MVEERKSPALSAHRSIAATGKPDGVVIGLRRVFGYHAKRLIDTVVVDKPDIRLTDVLDIRLVLYLEGANRSTNSEQTPCKKPFGEVVIIAQSAESGRRDRGDNMLKAL